MKEDFLHYVWRFLKFETSNLSTTNGKPVVILDNGSYNQLSGPDFFNAKIEIDNQLWAGNVEIHIRSSDWYAHQHQTDINYQNVILHVVFEDDLEVVDRFGFPLPTLELKNLITPDLIEFYKNQFLNTKKLKCDNLLYNISREKIEIYQNQLLLKKLDAKAIEIHSLLKQNTNYWEHIFCAKLFRNFGTIQNADTFEYLINAIPYKLLLSLQNNFHSLESLLYGMANMLAINPVDHYTSELKKEYSFLKNKFSLPELLIRVDYFKLRPDNFPTLRISQFVQCMIKNKSMFFELMAMSTLNDYYTFFNVQASEYWNNHYVFDKLSAKESVKNLSKNFIDLLLINTILPFKYAYYKDNSETIVDTIFETYQQIKFENNSVTSIYPKQFFRKESSLDSQSLVYLNKEFCSKIKCLSCTIGTNILYNYD